MKLIDEYILKKILATFFFVLLILIAIIVVIDLTEKVDRFSKNNLSLSSILGYYSDYVPWIAGLISPIIIFIAIVYVTSRLASHTEIIAMLSSGVSFPRLLVPYFLGSLILASISFVLNGWVIPKSNKERLDFELQYLKHTYYFDKRNIHMQVEHDVYLFIQNYNNQTNTGYQFTLERFKDNRLIEKLTADNIIWDTTKNIWVLKNWTRTDVDNIFYVPAEQVKDLQDSLRMDTSIQMAGVPTPAMPGNLRSSGNEMDTLLNLSPNDFENEVGKYDGMTINELSEHISKLRFRGATGVEVYEVERHIRFAAPFTIFVLVFMGVLVSARKSRGGTGFQIALGFLLAFVFILFFMLTRTFAEAGSLPPVIAAWLPNFVFGLVSLLMYRYVPH